MPTSIDTNVLIAFLGPLLSQEDERQFAKASELLQAVNEGRASAIISEIVLHECHYVMVTRAKMLENTEFCDAFQDILSWPGWLVSEEELGILVRGLEILEEHPKLEFSDAVIAARAEVHGAVLATFDRRLAEAFGGPIWAES